MNGLGRQVVHPTVFVLKTPTRLAGCQPHARWPRHSSIKRLPRSPHLTRPPLSQGALRNVARGSTVLWWAARAESHRSAGPVDESTQLLEILRTGQAELAVFGDGVCTLDLCSGAMLGFHEEAEPERALAAAYADGVGEDAVVAPADSGKAMVIGWSAE